MITSSLFCDRIGMTIVLGLIMFDAGEVNSSFIDSEVVLLYYDGG